MYSTMYQYLIANPLPKLWHICSVAFATYFALTSTASSPLLPSLKISVYVTVYIIHLLLFTAHSSSRKTDSSKLQRTLSSIHPFRYINWRIRPFLCGVHNKQT
ncbi:hypothetical protein EV421DRAFT_1028205 [Armillaria borealis]|uniref:Uncharacterized protein n=1 Tax=Armillaria borealis TaxID=47425 RepID=A0AA39J737_9AGAR|nr:hypothetical protein EV421DRAFT_1028205 [Armillaria borealis]